MQSKDLCCKDNIYFCGNSFIMQESISFNPISFFESFLNNESVKTFENSFYEPYIYNDEFRRMFDDIKIDRDNQKVILYLSDVDENGNHYLLEEERYFSHYLKQNLGKELKKSKDIIEQFVSECKHRGENITDLFDWQLKKIEQLKRERSLLLQKYPVCLFILDDVISYIRYQIAIEQIDIESISLQANPIRAIFSFLGGYNKDRQKIMLESEYERLIHAIKEMIKTESKLPITPIQRINIPNDLLRYCFYLLHKQLYGIRPQKKFILEFMKENLQQFQNTEFSTLVSDFSKKPYSTSDNYIPDVIKSTFKSKES